MRDILAEIVEAKKDVVAKAKEQLPLQQVKKLAKAHVGCFPMNYRFKANGWGLIAECKLQSPSKGNFGTIIRWQSWLKFTKKPGLPCFPSIQMPIF